MKHSIWRQISATWRTPPCDTRKAPHGVLHVVTISCHIECSMWSLFPATWSTPCGHRGVDILTCHSRPICMTVVHASILGNFRLFIPNTHTPSPPPQSTHFLELTTYFFISHLCIKQCPLLFCLDIATGFLYQKSEFWFSGS